MAAVNPVPATWPRSIYASISGHLHTEATAGSLQLRVDFTDGESAAWKAATTKAQATITGPSIKNHGHGEFDVVVDVFISVTSDRTDDDYDHIDAVGIMAKALDQCIIVKDYGVTGLVEIGTLLQGRADSDLVATDHLRPLKTDDQIFSTIRARFEGTFTE